MSGNLSGRDFQDSVLCDLDPDTSFVRVCPPVKSLSSLALTAPEVRNFEHTKTLRLKSSLLPLKLWREGSRSPTNTLLQPKYFP